MSQAEKNGSLFRVSVGNKCDRGGRRKVGVQEAKDWAERLFLKTIIWNKAEKFPNFSSSSKHQFSFSPCSIHLGRYNMIFVETSAKDNTGVEQVSFDSTAESDPNSPFLCDQHIHLDCRLSWSWWTECYRAQASGALAKVSPPLLLPKLGRPSWGESKYLNASRSNVFISRPQQRRTSSPPPCCGT